MTAVHLMVGDDAAYLASDGAMIDDAGIVVALLPKQVSIDPIRLAFACSGRCNVGSVCEELAKMYPKGARQRDIGKALPKILRTRRAEVRRERPQGEFDGTNVLRIYLAMFTDDGPRCLILSSDDWPEVGAKAFKWLETDGLVVPDPALSLPQGYWKGPADSTLLFAAQRRTPFNLVGGGFAVGGRCTLTTLKADGVTHTTVAEYPDKIGEKIAAEVPASRSRN